MGVALMNDGFQVDPGVLEDIASTLRHTSNQLDSSAESAPAPPDAGKASPAVAAILAKLVENAGQLVVATAAAGDAVAKGGAAYVEQDAQARDSVQATGPN